MSPFAQAAFRTKDGVVHPSGQFHNIDVLPEATEIQSEGFLGHDNIYYTRDEATKILGVDKPIQSEHLQFANGEQMQKSEFVRRVRSWMVKRKIYRAKPLQKGEILGKVPPNFTPGLQSAEVYLKSMENHPEFAAARTLSGRHTELDLLRDAMGLYDDPYHQALHAHGLEPHEDNVAKLKALVGADINELTKSTPTEPQFQLPSADGSHYPVAGPEVSGLRVSEDIPNMASIGATFDQYKVHSKVREVPISDFPHPSAHDMFYDLRDHARVKDLVNQIHASGELNPLIVAYDKEGPYILEGGHRLAALHAMGKKTIPALVVHDRTNQDLEKSYKDQIPGGRADNRKPSDFNQEQLLAGTKHEMEHTNDETLAREIAIDHLAEDSQYYVKLKLVESTEKSEFSWFSKGELQIPGLMPQDIQPANVEAEHTAQAVSEACKDGLCYDIILGGRHSLGAKIALDEQTRTFWLLKPGSGNQSRAVGLHETVGTQAEREVCFSSVATNIFDVHNYPKTALLNIDGTQVAAVAMATPSYVAAQDLGAIKCREALREYLETGDIHKFAILDFVLGNTDSHGHNMLIEPDEKKVLLIDHGGAFSGRSFAPGHDPYTFIPFYLRLWNPLDYQKATPEERASAIPAPQPGLDAQLAHWLRGISPEKVAAALEMYSIDDGGAAVSRLATLQESETPGADVVKYWSGYNLS